MKCKKFCNGVFGIFLKYETVKIVSINSLKIGLLCRFLQLAIIGYLIGYVLIYKKGYQEFDSGSSGLISKVKGVSLTNRTITGRGNVWDVADYTIPPQEKDAFFITTNALITRKQVQGKCPEDKRVEGSKCTNDDDCKKDQPILLGNGVKTGICDQTNGTCEIYAWCPVETKEADDETVKGVLLKNVDNFTVLIKNTVEFEKFKISRSNVPSDYNKTKLASCRYDAVNDVLCPIFTISTILNLANTKYEEIGVIGGIISVDINWDCNFDFSADYCYPEYKFRRLDKANSNISKGWNFRYANYYYIEGIQHRDLIKAYGIRFLITVKSRGGKFSIVPLTMNIGSGLALLGIATIICDFFVFYCLKKRKEYQQYKYLMVKGEDAYQPFQGDTESSFEKD